MWRTGVIFLFTLGAAAALLVAAWTGLFYSQSGRAFLTALVERELGDALNSRAEISAIRGGLPRHIIVEGLALSDEKAPAKDGPWLTADQIEIRWRPFALIKKRIIIDDVLLSGVYLRSDPPKDETKEDEARQLKIFGDAPHIVLHHLQIDDFRAMANGIERRIDGAGAARLDGAEISVTLNMRSDDGADIADITLDKSPLRGQFTLNATVKGEPGGALCTLTGLDGPLLLHATGDGPVNRAAIKVEGTVGYYGDISASIIANLDGFDGADLDLKLIPGKRINSITELSEPVMLGARYDTKQRGGALSVHKLTSALGEINGAVSWTAPRGVVDTLDANLHALLADDYRADIQAITGADLDLNANFQWRRDGYELDARLSGPLATFTLNEGETDLRRILSGEARLVAEPRENAPFWLEDGLTLETALAADFDASVKLDRLQITTGLGGRFAGAGAYQLNNDALDFKGDFILPAAFAEKLAPGAEFSGSVTGDLELSGPLALFTVKTAFETPSVAMNEKAIPPMNVQAALSGLPRHPNGNINAKAANDAPRRLDVELRSSGDGIIRVPALSYAGRGFSLDANGRFEPDRQTVNLTLNYRGDDEAEPWPGLAATGDLGISGVLSRDGALNLMTASANAITINDVALKGLALTAEGPPGAIEVTVTSDSIETASTGEITNLSAQGQLDARSAPRLMLSEFEAIIRDNLAKLTAPARLVFDNGVDIRDLRLAWGRRGLISLDGAFSDQRWRAQASLDNVNIPDADGQITAAITLDTNTDTPASGEFSLRSLLVNEENASIEGAFLWNGENLRLTDRGDKSLIDMDVRLPFRLVKTPGISIDTSGSLSGRVRYDGDIQALAAYMPPILQSIEGDLAADFALSGSLNAPALSGSANLTGGAYTEIESGFSLAGLHAEASASYGDASTALSFKGGARGADQKREDTITFEGALHLGEQSDLNIAVKLDGAELSAHPVNQVRANGELTLGGALDALKAKGDITITELDAEIATPESTGLVDIDVVAFNKNEDAAPQAQTPSRSNSLQYDIHVAADDRIFIRGRGLESEWSADVSVTAHREGPLVLGSLSLRRGWLDFSGRRFELTEGAVAFDRLEPNNPQIDMRAEHETSDGVTAAIVISGRASEPVIELTSTPTLPSEDVMALVLFGKPAQDLSPFESLQTAEALASLSGIGPFGGEGLTGRLRRTVGLDLLNVDIDPESGGGSLTVGKYVAKGVFISASQDAQGREGSVSVKYEITDNIVVETELEQDGDQTVSANWKKDF